MPASLSLCLSLLHTAIALFLPLCMIIAVHKGHNKSLQPCLQICEAALGGALS